MHSCPFFKPLSCFKTSDDDGVGDEDETDIEKDEDGEYAEDAEDGEEDEDGADGEEKTTSSTM